MADIVPVTRQDLVASVGKSLAAQARLREVMAGVAAETAAAKAQAAAAPAKT
jgi:hypothetical protein